MRKLVFDFETTTRNKGHPFDYGNRACVVGFLDVETKQKYIFKLEYDDDPYGDSIQGIKDLLSGQVTLIGFNGKFDLHWLRRYGLLHDGIGIFDCQLAWYILTAQKNKYPSLDQVAEYFGVEKKLDVVATEYWDKGIDTLDIPWNILEEYLIQDLVVTFQIYSEFQKKAPSLSYKMRRLISLSMADQMVLEDIEANGILLDVQKSIQKGDELVQQVAEIDNNFKAAVNAPWLNINSKDQLSCVLYGGTILLDGVEDYVFNYKDGRTANKTRKIKVPVDCPRIFKPLEGTALAKEGFYSTNEDTLVKLSERANKSQKEIISFLLTRAKLEKLRGTYFHGYPEKVIFYHWEDNIIHSSFNQCVAVSGRLSSDKPNVQNIAGQVKEVLITRFPIRRKRNEAISNRHYST